MTSRHFLRHLAIAYNHFHPIDEHKRFAERLKAYEKQRMKGELLAQLASMDTRCELAINESNSEELSSLRRKIKAIKSKLEAS